MAITRVEVTNWSCRSTSLPSTQRVGGQIGVVGPDRGIGDASAGPRIRVRFRARPGSNASGRPSRGGRATTRCPRHRRAARPPSPSRPLRVAGRTRPSAASSHPTYQPPVYKTREVLHQHPQQLRAVFPNSAFRILNFPEPVPIVLVLADCAILSRHEQRSPVRRRRRNRPSWTPSCPHPQPDGGDPVHRSVRRRSRPASPLLSTSTGSRP